MQNIQDDVFLCPSFNSYSSDKLAELAVKVAGESSKHDENDEEFEFSLVQEDKDVSSDQFIQSGIGPVFPVFNRDLLFDEDNESSGGACRENEQSGVSSVAVPLSKLFLEDREDDNPPSCSSSEADELDNVPAGTYCVWRPKPASPSVCKKSKSTGSDSKRWRFRDLLRRSNSEGKDSFVFLTPSKNHREDKKLLPSIEPSRKAAKGKGVSGRVPGSPSAHEELYVRNRALKEVDKKKSYLPYRRDLVGFFVNANVLGKSFPHL